MGFPVSPKAILTVLCSGDDLGICRFGLMINQARGWLGRLSINPVSWMVAENSISLIFLGQGCAIWLHMTYKTLGSQGILPHSLTAIPEHFAQVWVISIISQRTLGLLKIHARLLLLLCMSILSQSVANLLCTLTTVYQASCKHTGGLYSVCLQQLPRRWGWKTQACGIAGWHHKTARGWTVPAVMQWQLKELAGHSVAGTITEPPAKSGFKHSEESRGKLSRKVDRHRQGRNCWVDHFDSRAMWCREVRTGWWDQVKLVQVGPSQGVGLHPQDSGESYGNVSWRCPGKISACVPPNLKAIQIAF